MGDDAARPDELVPQGGTWRGLVFENPRIGLERAPTWQFEIEFADIERDYGDTPVSLTVDWVPLPGAAWSAMEGQAAMGDEFGEPIECSACFFEHYRYGNLKGRGSSGDFRFRVPHPRERD